MEVALEIYQDGQQYQPGCKGGTPISVCVKGHKKKVKLKPFLDKVSDKWSNLTKDGDQIEREVDAYLKRLKRRILPSS